MRKPWRALTFIDQHHAPEHDHQALQRHRSTPANPAQHPATIP